jgi:DICT domain-containing protein
MTGETMTIGALAEASGVAEGTLRIWETRHGFPEPRRLESGHRRYDIRDLAGVREVLRARAEGLLLPAAIARARRQAEAPRTSVFAALRERFPELLPRALPKRALVPISHAIEDECCQRAEQPVLFAGFQHERFYRQAEDRWRELARTARSAVVFADFHATRRALGTPDEVALDGRSDLLREWVVVCDSERFAACLVGWERPQARNRERTFEAFWTLDRAITREAARVCVGLARRLAPDLTGGLSDLLADTPPRADSDLQAATELATRMTDYLTSQPVRPLRGRGTAPRR